MATKSKQEKLQEKVRDLRKKECNKVCFDCGEKGPQVVCTTFNTFVCMMCSGIHREFSHRVKNISMSTFEEAEVEALEKGGNDAGRSYWLKKYREGDFAIPDVNEPRVIREKRIRDFIRMKYLEKRWVGREKEDKKEDKKKKKKKDKSDSESSSGSESSDSDNNDKKKKEKEK